jgi:hypothetical protein
MKRLFERFEERWKMNTLIIMEFPPFARKGERMFSYIVLSQDRK